MFNDILKKIVVDFLSSRHNIFFIFSSFSYNVRKTIKSKALHSLAHTIGCSFERHCPPLPIPPQQHPHIIANLFAKCHRIEPPLHASSSPITLPSLAAPPTLLSNTPLGPPPPSLSSSPATTSHCSSVENSHPTP